MSYKKISAEDITTITQIVGEENVILPSNAGEIESYKRDYTENLSYTPELVAKPNSTEQIAKLMLYCSEHLIPITPRGGGTGLSGGCLTPLGGISLSLENLNHILEIDEGNLQVTTEPGVITEVLQNAVEQKGLFYPPDPSSRGSCFIGGNIAENSGGPKAVKYGVVKDYVLNLEVVLPSGKIIWTGANVLKNATGYNLTQLIVGSEGTLGVVTKIVLRLIPAPKYELMILVPFKSLEEASQAVSKIFQSGYTPSVLELMERDALILASNYIKNTSIPIGDDVEAHLIIAVDGHHLEVLEKEIENIAVLISENYATEEILFAEDEKQKNELWKLRRSAAEAAKTSGHVIEEDIVVPRAKLPHIIKHTKELSKMYDFSCICYGHAGDGNLHVRIKKEGVENTKDNPAFQKVLEQLFQKVGELGGTISGEHGIGMLQKQFIPIFFSETELTLMKNIKSIFDPHHILNPGKIF